MSCEVTIWHFNISVFCDISAKMTPVNLLITICKMHIINNMLY